jgi:hypothetical protein
LCRCGTKNLTGTIAIVRPAGCSARHIVPIAAWCEEIAADEF